MKDLHSHILYGIDDGSENIEDSLLMLKQAEASGYTDLIITPHYRSSEGFITDREKENKILNKLRFEASKKNIKINLHLGCEITIDDDFLYLIDSNQVARLANSRYVLIELPFFDKLENLDEILDSLAKRKLIPIVAHPERCLGYTLADYEKMLKRGVLLQGNFESLYNKYGKKAKKRLEKMLRMHMISFVGSDIHNSNQHSFEKIRAVKERLINLTKSIEMTNDLIDLNIQKIIENKYIKPYPKREEIKERKSSPKIDKQTRAYLIIKRIFDILASIIGIIILLPVLLVVKISYLKEKDYAPIIFKQARIGKDGKIFEFYKLRSMIPNADEVLFKYLKSNPEAAREYKQNKKLKEDPRITKMGKVLRRTSLDELPQFINILKGDMSLIGNRPYLPREKKDMGEYYKYIIKSKPGLTGYWQVIDKNDDTSFANRLELEKFYSLNMSLKMDTKIFFKTFKAVFKGHGAGI